MLSSPRTEHGPLLPAPRAKPNTSRSVRYSRSIRSCRFPKALSFLCLSRLARMIFSRRAMPFNYSENCVISEDHAFSSREAEATSSGQGAQSHRLTSAPDCSTCSPGACSSTRAAPARAFSVEVGHQRTRGFPVVAEFAGTPKSAAARPSRITCACFPLPHGLRIAFGHEIVEEFREHATCGHQRLTDFFKPPLAKLYATCSDCWSATAGQRWNRRLPGERFASSPGAGGPSPPACNMANS